MATPTKEQLKLQIIERLERGPRGRRRPLNKTRVIRIITGRYWFLGGGYVSGWFCHVSKTVTAAMNELIEDGKVRYTPLKPLELIS